MGLQINEACAMASTSRYESIGSPCGGFVQGCWKQDAVYTRHIGHLFRAMQKISGLQMSHVALYRFLHATLLTCRLLGEKSHVTSLLWQQLASAGKASSVKEAALPRLALWHLHKSRYMVVFQEAIAPEKWCMLTFSTCGVSPHISSPACMN